MLNADQWTQIAHIGIWMLASGNSDKAYWRWAVADQLGEWAASQIAWNEWDWVIDHVYRGWQAGNSNEQVAALLVSGVQPWLSSVTGNQPEAPGGELTADQRSAKANLDGFLSQFGLESLGEFVWQEYLNNIPIEQIMLDMRSRPEYKARFPAMETLAQKGHAMSEAEYVGYEKQVAGLAQAAGFPPGMFDQPDDFAPLLENELSVQEVSQRFQDWLSFADSAPEVNKLELQRLYGVGPGGIAAYFMNPDKALPLLEKEANAALTGASAIQSGYGQLSQAEAEQIGGFGYEPAQTREGFGNLVSQRELFNPLDVGEDAISREAQLGAMFGAHAPSQQEIERRASRRAAYFQQGGGFSSGEQGLSGIGTAR